VWLGEPDRTIALCEFRVNGEIHADGQGGSASLTYASHGELSRALGAASLARVRGPNGPASTHGKWKVRLQSFRSRSAGTPRVSASRRPSSHHHSLAFPNFRWRCADGKCRLDRIGANPCSRGSGYFTTRLVRKHEVTGRLHRVTRAPEFRLPVYLVYATKSDSEVLTLALDTVRRIVAETQ